MVILNKPDDSILFLFIISFYIILSIGEMGFLLGVFKFYFMHSTFAFKPGIKFDVTLNFDWSLRDGTI